MILESTGINDGEFYRRGTVLWGGKQMGGSATVLILEDCCRDAEKEIPSECYQSRDRWKHGMPMYSITLV